LIDGHVDIDWQIVPPPHEQIVKDFLFVNSTIQLPYLFHLLDKSGFQLVETHTSRYRGASVALAVILYPLIYWAQRRKYNTAHPLFQQMTSLVWLAGRHNIIICKKKP
jgi:hypothetical protein